MSKASDSGKAFLDQVLAKLPESLRDGVKTAFAAPEAADALTAVGDGVLARADYSRAMDEIKAKETTLTSDYDNLNAWYAENKDRLGKVESLEQQIAKLQGQAPNPPPPSPTPSPGPAGLTREDIDKILLERDKGYARVLGLTTQVAARHLRVFGEEPDMQGVIDIATKKGVSLEDAYREKYSEQLAEKAKAAEHDRVEKLVAERLADERKKQADQPFPLRNASPSVLDVLEQKDRPAHDVDSAVAEYERLQAARG